MGNIPCIHPFSIFGKMMGLGFLLWSNLVLGVCSHSDAHPMLLELLECSEKQNKIPMFSEMLKSDFFQKVITPGLISICQDGCHLVREEQKLKECYVKMAQLLSTATFTTPGANGQSEKFVQYLDRLGKEKYATDHHYGCRTRKDILDKYLSLNSAAPVSPYESCIYTKSITIAPANINCGSKSACLGEVFCSFGPHRGAFQIACAATEGGKCPAVAECAEGEQPFWIRTEQENGNPINTKVNLPSGTMGQ